MFQPEQYFGMIQGKHCAVLSIKTNSKPKYLQWGFPWFLSLQQWWSFYECCFESNFYTEKNPNYYRRTILIWLVCLARDLSVRGKYQSTKSISQETGMYYKISKIKSKSPSTFESLSAAKKTCLSNPWYPSRSWQGWLTQAHQASGCLHTMCSLGDRLPYSALTPC